MLYNNTVEKLREMKLGAMAKSFQSLMHDNVVSDLSFEERFSMLVDEEYTARRNNRLKRLARSAHFECPDDALEDIEYRADRQLDKNLIARLSSCAYVNEHHNIILMGATGSGKTYIANAFGVKAVQNFYTVRYIRLPELLAELAVAKMDGTYQKLLKQYANIKLLIIDEWLLYTLKESEAIDLLELAERRYKKGSTIFCSQFDIGVWHIKIGESTLADAIVDRIVHDSYKIVIGGNDSMRKVNGLKDEG